MFQEIGEYLTELGLQILPYSFFAYFIVRLLEYKWNYSYTKLVKSIVPPIFRTGIGQS